MTQGIIKKPKKAKKQKYEPNLTIPLPKIISVEEINKRLEVVFPDSYPDRTWVVGKLCARVIYVFIYGGFIEAHERYLRPAHIYLFTDKQAKLTSGQERYDWIKVSHINGYRAEGKQWYSDTSKEQIRDDLMRNHLLRLGIMKKLDIEGHATTSSTPINYLDNDFFELMNPDLSDKDFSIAADLWRELNLDASTLQRMALRSSGAANKKSDIFINMPDGTRMKISSGPSNEIVKSLIEEFATKHLHTPLVLWISASDKKSYPQFVQLAESVGLKFDLNAVLPDLILADLGKPIKYILCEVVASDGPITEYRKNELLEIIKSSNISENTVQFLTAFEDREAQPFRKNFSQLAVDSLVWFRTEPDLLIILTTDNNILP